MDKFSIKIDGLDRLINKIESLKQNVQPTMQQSLNKSMMIICSYAKALCPVDNGVLRNSLISEVVLKDGKLIGRIYTNIYYAT